MVRQPKPARALIATLFAAALVMRLLVPAGWMPRASGDGLVLSWCSGAGHAPPAEARALLKAAMPDPRPAKHSGGNDIPCSFAAAAQPATPAAFIAVAAPIAAPLSRPSPIILASVPGRGLAAPPPRPTGPPLPLA